MLLNNGGILYIWGVNDVICFDRFTRVLSLGTVSEFENFRGSTLLYMYCDLNSQHANIKFKYELENENSIYFLDMQVHKNFRIFINYCHIFFQ